MFGRGRDTFRRHYCTCIIVLKTFILTANFRKMLKFASRWRRNGTPPTIFSMRIGAGWNVNMEDYAAQINYFKSFSKEMWPKLTEETNLCVSAEKKLVNTYPPSTGFRHGCWTQNFWTPVITGKLPAISTCVIFFCFQTLRLHFIYHKNPDFMANCHFSSCTKTIYIFSPINYLFFFHLYR